MTSGEELLKVVSYYNLVDGQTLNEKFKIICPFHADLNASMQIDLLTGRFYCYGCGEKGYALEFVKKMEKCNDLKAMIVLSKILGDAKKSNHKIRYTEAKTDEELMEDAKLYFYSLSKPSWEYINNSYMHSRGFDSKVLIGVDARINANKNYGIIFPMLDNGEFKGYVCRATDKKTEEFRKYLYNKGFSRRNTLVGDYNTKKWVVIVEGYMDWLKMRQFGVKKCCAILGWKITRQQIEKIKQYTNNIICALDNTETGEKGYEYLKKHFNVVRFQFGEKEKDPGELDEFSFKKAWLDTLAVIKKNKKSK